MPTKPDRSLVLPVSKSLQTAIQKEGKKFQEYYLWLESAMPENFFEEVSPESLLLITHSLMGFDLQDYFSTINLKSAAIALCLDSADADLRILEYYSLYGIKSYQAYVSKTPPPFAGITAPLRIATISFTEAAETQEKTYPQEWKDKIYQLLKTRNDLITQEEFNALIAKVNNRFLHALSTDQLSLAIDMLFWAQTRDNCQYEVYYNKHWEQQGFSSMQVILAWRNTPRYHFLYNIARIIHRHGLIMRRVHATYIDPYSKDSILVMALDLHGSNGQPVWDVASIPDFLRELVTFKYFISEDLIDEQLVNKNIISGNMGHLLRAMTNFIHQTLVHIDANLYTVDNVEEALCRHPELTVQLCEAFKFKFHPDVHNCDQYQQVRQQFLNDVHLLDTGQEENDSRRKNVLQQGMNFIDHVLKTNFYRLNYTALSFRLAPTYLDHLPFDRSKKFPELPYAIFFIKGMHFFAFHIRFKDLARGGLRTVYPQQFERMVAERNNVFTECYNLALTQQKKNKDIPEGGAKAVIFLKPFDRIDTEAQILKRELELARVEQQEIEGKLTAFKQEQQIEFLYQAQKAFIESLITIVNCDPDGTIRAKHIVDYWKKPEYIYLGPDENMHDFMIEWIANFSKKYHYKPGAAFISSKPKIGINHKEYGVTSLGVNVYMHQMLEFLQINPLQDTFTVKMSGGPDGDVAGNQLLNLYRFYPNTAKVIALTDGTGTIYDEKGLDLSIVKDLFYQAKGIAFYPPEKLSEEGFLVDKNTKRYQTAYVQETLCWRKIEGNLVEDWLSGSEMNQLLRFNVHKTKTDIFIPAGGRPRTLNESNVKDFLDDKGNPTAKAIIEGANLYLTPQARRYLEEKGVLIIKDSSANKAGVICSSFEVLCGLALSEEIFLNHKSQLVSEILERLKQCALNEAVLLLETHKQTGAYLTDISDRLSEKINQYTYQILDYLEHLPLAKDLNDPLVRCFLNYCLPTLQNKFSKELMKQIPDPHKKAIIACHLAAYMVYKKGVNWSPSIVDILPLILSGTSLTR
jgi:glutamate dehydrogenase